MARQKSRGQVYVARESGHTEIDGVPYVFHKGVTRIGEGHPLSKIKGFENIFESADIGVDFGVEQATDAPGETRDVMLGEQVGPLDAQTVVELRETAKKHGITPGTMNKQELIDAIEAAEK
jgi:hypothetical protein